MTEPAPKRNAPSSERPVSGPEVDRSSKAGERKTDQGIRRDQRGQDQPRDKDRAQS